ncbi:SGNH/GDSL hydrolase family protein [Coraliomargarita sp. SDUM461004]|uniref:SGNH/GDSL hydrolase family protein n=1 Tax=Thalassobacterium sedimentorum TaxID=3041258 RepID=A0ABU1ADU0_9BACT|nr:GDSL-type esterase/lipase family protein [Coraliomargarita sp. SDUM461004]MDQ8192825.1 SGNH/GDSL hydrolase family protein [Coraliomargarita sp. SDUM461004]
MKLSTSDIQFHNAHLEARPDGSYQIARYPRDVLNQMNDGARRTGIDSCGAEIRFHTTAPTTRITLSCEHAEGEVQIFRGPFLCETVKLEKGVPTAIDLTPNDRLQEATDDILESGGFSTSVWRLLLGRGSFRYHFINTFGHSLRAPRPEELPSVNWLAYGSSITHSHLAGHPYQASRLLHWNLHAKGLSGSCHLEPAATDYFAKQIKESNLDIITAELGVNMRVWYSVEEFTQRAKYFIKTLRAAAPGKPIVLITIFTNSAHYSRDTERAGVQTQIGFDNSLRKLHADANDPDLHLIEGTELLPDFTLLNSDVLHPSPSGQALMGHLLAERLRRILPQSID